MRVKIKGADFSAVSIGKVLKDLSKSFDWNDGVEAQNEFFVNYNSGTPTVITYYYGSSLPLGQTTNANRISTDFIETREGMKYTLEFWQNTASVPSIVMFNENKEVIDAGWANTQTAYLNGVIPANVKYIKLQMQIGNYAKFNLVD